MVGTVPSFSRALVCGMGGSAFPARLLLSADPSLPLSIHQDYGLPPLATDERPLVVLSSYSGDTEEVLDAAEEATRRNLPCVVIASGGALLTIAHNQNIPHITLPKETIEPRMAIGYAMLALLRVLGKTELEATLRDAGKNVDTAAIRAEGVRLAKSLHGRIPLIYTSRTNAVIAYLWKITFNETAKIPAFLNEVPELCHNELSGFDVVPATTPLSAIMTGIFIHDVSDHPRNKKRLTLVSELMREKGMQTTHVELSGSSRFANILSGVLLGTASALTLAKMYGVPDAKTPLIADFKLRMKS